MAVQLFANAVRHAAAGQDANFRTFVSRTRTMLSSNGWIQQADTGQIDPVTVAAPGAGASMAGYEIWKSIAPNVNCHDFYMRIEYWGYTPGGGSSIGTYKISVGWATDGAGNLTGLKTANVSPIDNNGLSGSTTVAELIMMSNDKGLFCDAPISEMVFVSRMLDNNGEYTDDIWTYAQNYWSGIGIRYDAQMLSYDKVWNRVSNSTSYPVLAGSNLMPANGRIGVGFIFGLKAGYTNPLESVLHTAIASGTASFFGPNKSYVTLTIYGRQNTYLTYAAGWFGLGTGVMLLKTN